jgi:hypothetical protein
MLKKTILTAELSNPDSYRELQRAQSSDIVNLFFAIMRIPIARDWRSDSYRNLRLTDFDFFNTSSYQKNLILAFGK